MTEKRTMISGSKPAQQLKELIARGKEQGYLTYAEVNDHLPNDIVDPEQIEDIVNMINDMGIAVHEKRQTPNPCCCPRPPFPATTKMRPKKQRLHLPV